MAGGSSNFWFITAKDKQVSLRVEIYRRKHSGKSSFESENKGYF
jgi:hypothetical protein